MNAETPLHALIRTEILKVPQNESEDERFRKICAAQGRQRAPTVRELIASFCDAYEARVTSPCKQPHVSACRMNAEGPRHGHFASGLRRQRASQPVRMPGRGGFGGMPLQLRV